MQKIVPIALPLFFFCFFAQAQNKITYEGSFSTGVLAGAGNPGWQAQVVNGVKYKIFSAGAGVGLDYYHTRSVPVFFETRVNAVNKPRTAFFYLDAGHNIPWLQNAAKAFVENTSGGLYAEGGAGYEELLFKKARIFFGVGWRVKKFSEKVNTMPYLSVWPPPETAYRTYDYKLTSIALKAGLHF